MYYRTDAKGVKQGKSFFAGTTDGDFKRMFNALIRMFRLCCKRYLRLAITMSCCLMLSSCDSPAHFFSPKPYLTGTGQAGVIGSIVGGGIGQYATTGGATGGWAGILAGGIVGVTLGHFIEQHQTVLERIQQHGVKIVAVGDNLLFVLPTDKFFHENSPNREQISDPILDELATLLRSYEKITVKVAAFTDTTCSPQRALALTEQQAQVIVDYLWSLKTDTRIMYGRGYGSRYPIASNATRYGRAQNRRIEVTLRLLPRCCVLGVGSG